MPDSPAPASLSAAPPPPLASPAGGLLSYVMPYVAGETLRARLACERQLPVDDAARIAREVADALGADFGIALAVQEAAGQRLTQAGLSLGTPQYMSPESDVHALGAVTHEMLAGEPPFTGATVQVVVGEHWAGEMRREGGRP